MLNLEFGQLIDTLRFLAAPTHSEKLWIVDNLHVNPVGLPLTHFFVLVEIQAYLL